MATVRKVIDGLTILARYDPDGLDSHSVSAEHDVIYGPGPGDPDAVTEEDRERLEELGWHLDSEADCWARFV